VLTSMLPNPTTTAESILLEALLLQYHLSVKLNCVLWGYRIGLEF